jgi:hypothetical protein
LAAAAEDQTLSPQEVDLAKYVSGLESGNRGLKEMIIDARDGRAEAGNLRRGLGSYCLGYWIEGDVLRYFEKSAECGFAPAFAELGYHFRDRTGHLGLAGTLDMVQAEDWFRKGASSGDPRGLFGFYIHQIEHKALGYSPIDHLNLLLMASDKGWVNAHSSLAELYFKGGTLVKKNLGLAIKYSGRFMGATGATTYSFKQIVFDMKKKKVPDLPKLCFELGKCVYWDLGDQVSDLDQDGVYLDQCMRYYCQVMDSVQASVLQWLHLAKPQVGRDVALMVGRMLWCSRTERIWYLNKGVFEWYFFGRVAYWE